MKPVQYCCQFCDHDSTASQEYRPSVVNVGVVGSDTIEEDKRSSLPIFPEGFLQLVQVGQVKLSSTALLFVRILICQSK